MNRLAGPQRSGFTAGWLFTVATLVFAMVVVGGATRLTHSGLSITQWKPISGVVPPLDLVHWRGVFARYQSTPEYQLVNRGMTLAQFKEIYWWEWSHRLLGRLVGAVTLVGFVLLVAMRRLPQRLIGRCALLPLLVAFQGLIGWWMVMSGLSVRTSVAPERLSIHLGSALLIFLLAVWTGLETLATPDRVRPSRGWTWAAGVILVMACGQALLGGLVAGDRAGLIYNDWPLMNGKWIAPIDWKGGILHAFLHDYALVQFDHRIGAYALFLAVWGYALQAYRSPMPESGKLWASGLALAVTGQALLGIATLMSRVPLWLGALHQAGAVVVLALATINLWRMLRVEERLVSAGIAAFR
jgi:cytochrome c oxidase assembly protein subunit 15